MRKKPIGGVADQLCGGLGGEPTRSLSRRKPVKVPFTTRPDATRVASEVEFGDVQVVPLPARLLMTIGPGDEHWKTKKLLVVEGAIYRVKPPAQATDADVDALVSALVSGRACAVTVHPREASAAVVARKAANPGTSSSARRVVLDMVAEARTDDREALSRLCEDIMTEVGLR